MGWKIAFCVLLAAALVGFLQWCKRKLLFPMPLAGYFVLAPKQLDAGRLEQQLRCCRWLRQMGLLRARTVIVADDLLPAQQPLLDALQRQGLADEILLWEAFSRMRTIDWGRENATATGAAAGDRERSGVL